MELFVAVFVVVLVVLSFIAFAWGKKSTLSTATVPSPTRTGWPRGVSMDDEIDEDALPYAYLWRS